MVDLKIIMISLMRIFSLYLNRMIQAMIKLNPQQIKKEKYSPTINQNSPAFPKNRTPSANHNKA